MALCFACLVDLSQPEELDLRSHPNHPRRKAEAHINIRPVYRTPNSLCYWATRHAAHNQIRRCVATSVADTGQWQCLLPECVSTYKSSHSLQIASVLPLNTNIYGLGEVVASSGFRRDVDATIQTMWARDIADPVDQNV